MLEKIVWKKNIDFLLNIILACRLHLLNANLTLPNLHLHTPNANYRPRQATSARGPG